MNISTYEARIAALEAQLGPGPGPVQETGLVSVVVTPDIALSDGNSLNNIIATHMPLVSGEKIEALTREALATEYTVTITPGSSWKAFFTGDGSDAGSVGETISKVYNVSENTLTFDVFASSDPLDDEAPFAEIEVRIPMSV